MRDQFIILLLIPITYRYTCNDRVLVIVSDDAVNNLIQNRTLCIQSIKFLRMGVQTEE